MKGRVLLLTPPFRPNIGGVETHLDDLILAGEKTGIHFTVLTYQPLVTKEYGKFIETGRNYKIFRMPWLRANLFLTLEKYPILEFLYLFPPLFIVTFIYLIFRGKDIKVIHSQGLVAGTIGVVVGKFFSKRVIISTHSIYNFKKGGLYTQFVKTIFKNCDQILTLSNQSREEVVSLGIDPEKVNTFKYWVDQNIFMKMKKSVCREKLHLPNGMIILFVGRLLEVKGVKELIKAANKIREEVYFLIVGDGPLKEFVIKNSQKNNKIIFKGKILNQDLPIFYNVADLLIVPSIHEEGFGRVILEALSCGLPVIAANRGGIKESITSDVGLLIDISPENIIKAIRKLSENRNNLKLMTQKARQFANKFYSQKNAEMIFKYYE